MDMTELQAGMFHSRNRCCYSNDDLDCSRYILIMRPSYQYAAKVSRWVDETA